MLSGALTGAENSRSIAVPRIECFVFMFTPYTSLNASFEILIIKSNSSKYLLLHMTSKPFWCQSNYCSKLTSKHSQSNFHHLHMHVIPSHSTSNLFKTIYYQGCWIHLQTIIPLLSSITVSVFEKKLTLLKPISTKYYSSDNISFEVPFFFLLIGDGFFYGSIYLFSKFFF